MFEGPGPLPVIRLPDGTWADKDPAVYARECYEYWESLRQPKPLSWTPVAVLAIIASALVAVYAIWG